MGFYALGSNSPDLAYVMGVMLGDACLYRMHNGKPHPHTGKPSLPSWRVELQVADRPFAEAFAYSLGRALKRPENRRVKVLTRSTERPGYQPVFRVAVASRGFGDWWDGEIGRSPEALRPHVIRQPRAFLRGLYDSEGNLSRGEPNPSVRIFSQNRATLELAGECLTEMDMGGQIVVFRKEGTEVMLPGGKPFTTRQDLLLLSPLPARRFLTEVGSSIPRKNI